MLKYSKTFLKKRPYVKLIDDFQCYVCNEKSVKMQIHHVDLDHTNDNFNNLVSLCPVCHSFVHSSHTVLKVVRTYKQYEIIEFLNSNLKFL